MTTLPRGLLGAWWAEGVRAAAGRTPRTQALALTPALVFVLWLVPQLVSVALERLYIEGPAWFYAPALLSTHWFGTVALLVACWFAAGTRAPLAVFATLCAASLPILVVTTIVILPTTRGAIASGDAGGLAWPVWALGMAYYYGITALALWRSGDAPRALRLVAIGLVIAAGGAQQAWMPVRTWYPLPAERDAAAEQTPRRDFLRQETFELQADALDRDLDALPAQRPGTVDVYALTYAPDAEEDVFQRESAMVAQVMKARFGAPTVQLVSRRDLAPSHAWATPLNLQRAIRRIAKRMDADEDVLFVHLTSHGGRDGRLAARFAPLATEDLTPGQLRQWLSQAGVRWRIVSVSACFSGSWVAPLADDETLVLTAADAEHTSYGCGRGSELTYFGRAMYDEALRRGAGFEAAHAQAREVIAEREKAAGKDDGYSNPQIAMGTAMRQLLRRLDDARR
jgi:hypothetical protein